MKIGVFGTGTVGSTIATKLVEAGHDVKMGSRTAGHEKALAWVKASGARASQDTYADAAAFGELLFNCTAGVGSMAASRPPELTTSPLRGISPGWIG